MKRYPTRNGIAVSPLELALPDSRYDWDNKHRTNNHHTHFTSKRFGQTAVTQCLRDLERHQYVMPVDVHNYLHDTYDSPELPTEEQAAREVIDAYEHGERFKRYDRGSKRYEYHDIPLDVVNRFMSRYALYTVFSMAAD